MIKFILRKIVFLIPVFIGITLVTFAVTELAPGDPVDIQNSLNPKVSLETKEKLKELYGLNKPLPERYALWVKNLIVFDFGYSFGDGQSVNAKIASRIPVTLLLNGLSLFFVLIIAIPLGIQSAIKENSAFDHWVSVFVFIGFALPTFWLALMLMTLFGIHWHVLPVSGITSLDFDLMNPWQQFWDLARHLILPILASTITHLAGITRFMRSSMLEVLNQDYIRTAKAKGLSHQDIYYKHALRNALLPIITILGLSVPGLLGGSVIFETVFALPGMGKLMYDAVMARDFPVYMAVLVIGAVLTLMGNLLADIAYRIADPRIGWDT